MKRPTIIIEFEPDHSVTWHSTGWGKDADLMQAAKRAINQGETPQEVIEFLTDAGFDVMELTTPKPTEH
jgi:hypothetical protein